MLELSKEPKEKIAVAQDRVSLLVDVILDLIVRFDHQFATSPHRWAAWACFFRQMHDFGDVDGLIFAAVSVFLWTQIHYCCTDIVFLDKRKKYVCGKIFSPFAH